MIAVRPGTDAWRLLAQVVRHPGLYTAEELAGVLWPVPAELRLRSAWPAEPAEPRLAVARPPRAEERARALRARAAHEEAARRKARRLLGRLVAQGLVEKRRPARVAPWVLSRWEREGRTEEAFALIVMRAHPAFPAVAPEDVRALVRLAREVERSPGVSMRHASGRTQRLYGMLVGMGVIESPAQRWPTEAGVALVGEDDEEARRAG